MVALSKRYFSRVSVTVQKGYAALYVHCAGRSGNNELKVLCLYEALPSDSLLVRNSFVKSVFSTILMKSSNLASS